MYQFLVIFLCFFSSLSADSWNAHWSRGVLACTNQDYVAGECEFNQAIWMLEKEGSIVDHAHIYIDRARLYFVLGEPQNVLNDINKALSYKLSQVDEGNARSLKYASLMRLDMHDEAAIEYELWKKVDPAFPKTEVFDDMMIIRNIPDSECYKKFIRAFMVIGKICESEDDITFLPSRICIIKTKKKCNCGCGCKAGIIRDKKTPEEEAEEDCKYYCARVATAAHAWCSHRMKNARCAAICAYAVDSLKEKCDVCCEKGSFYKNCIEPLSDIALEIFKYIGEGCEPIW